MSAKTTLLVLFLTGFGLLAQSQPAPAPNADTNRDELLRQALHQAIEAKTNPATARPVPAAALSVPLPTPLQATPVAPAETAPSDRSAPAAPSDAKPLDQTAATAPSDSKGVGTENPAPPGSSPAPPAAAVPATNRIALPKIPSTEQLVPADSSAVTTNRSLLPTNPVGGSP